MADWKAGMTRTYEYWKVNPSTWGDSERLDKVTGCTIIEDLDDDVMGHASFSMEDWQGEMYVRVYMVTVQDGVRERFVMGTFLVQASDWEFNGVRTYAQVDGYPPLKELADDIPPLGHSVSSGNTTDAAASMMRSHCRAPVVWSSGGTIITSACTADPSDTWLTFAKFVLAKGEERPDVDRRGVITVAPIRNPKAVAPSYVFDDSNSSILVPQMKVTNDLADVPNYVEVVYSKENGVKIAHVENADPDDEASTSVRGRRVGFRESAPDLPDNPTNDDVDRAARKLLDEKGAATYEITFTHAFVPEVRPGVGVKVRSSKAGLDVIALVVSTSIECTPACLVTTTARYMK